MTKWALAYIALVVLAFLAVYLALGVREMGLYLSLMVLNLPASVFVLPLVERLALALGWTLGAAPHVWATQVAAMLTNLAFLTAAARLARRKVAA